MARLIHHIGMWVVMVFAVMHINFVILASIAERIGTFDSIVSGYKFLSKRKTGMS
jgi:Ni,Fe-hydrogenase I cytochrome b subunit